MDDKKILSEEELRKRLTSDEYRVLRQKGTEEPFSGEYVRKEADGIYHCKVCDAPLFTSDNQEDATKSPVGLQGWPSFNNAIPGATTTHLDTSLGMTRTEITCATCGSHLGHIFDDPSTKTGAHYCINSVCLNLKEK
ncbi:MAG: peptide-methionine (R)-S-oxide reductase [Parcubacteria group bacterium RIFOXYD2_FULL_52_8]|nr:MAG: peptide-methionine (R)-S-oxide reductase [Parcubacteria group bacterium RIFOXYD2_FULL_52_8]